MNIAPVSGVAEVMLFTVNVSAVVPPAVISKGLNDLVSTGGTEQALSSNSTRKPVTVGLVSTPPTPRFRTTKSNVFGPVVLTGIPRKFVSY